MDRSHVGYGFLSARRKTSRGEACMRQSHDLLDERRVWRMRRQAARHALPTMVVSTGHA
jgi:hypothetical protein